MSVKIRLARGGSKKRPYYRIVVADARAPRDGDFLERVGSYNPILAKDNEQRVVLQQDRVEHWLQNGATPTERVALFLRKANIGQSFEHIKKLNKRHDNIVELKREEIEAKKKAQEEARKAAEAEAKAKAEAEAKEQAEKEAAEKAEAEAAEAAEVPAEEAPAEEAPAEEAPAEEAAEAPAEEEKAAE